MTQTTAPAMAQDLSRAALDARIVFHDTLKTMEADFSNFDFDTAETVNLFYDRLEERIAASGEDKWFFLVNLNGTRIEPDAWYDYRKRGKVLNHAHSMGSVRFDASDETRRQIQRAANTEAFDPNLFDNRAAALARIAELPSTRKTRHISDQPNYTQREIAERITFDESTVIMSADFSNMTFHHSRDVDDVYDHIEARIIESDRKWFFLVNLNGCEILPAAWVRYAHRGKRLNKAASLGSVRFAAGSETEDDIRMRARSQGFEPNIRNTLSEARARIEEMRSALLAEIS
ncbi:hypothetical protein [Primorskyibacter sp. S187A]|uniref:hypothetical protein n=1 Tax=Primorskyibacter sp. S187A TaxID=3415130 RepID=UPI003C7A32FF